MPVGPQTVKPKFIRLGSDKTDGGTAWGAGAIQTDGDIVRNDGGDLTAICAAARPRRLSG
jgi:hypothetical protein